MEKNALRPQGIRLGCLAHDASACVRDLLERHGLISRIETAGDDGQRLALSPATAAEWLPGFDTLGLAARLGLDTQGNPEHLERETLVALLGSPVLIDFPCCEELFSHLRIRRNIVVAGRLSSMDFRTDRVDRPEACWHDNEDSGFVVRPGVSMIEALKMATQPGGDGRMYGFSCYRATEYIILLAIAEELEQVNPPLFARLQKQCEKRVIRSGQFHDVFLRELGTQEAPIPARYYVPGDRVWFRNPDEASSDVVGYEGSWVMYLGDGLFTNFWKCDRPYTLESKCIEVHHWRDGVVRLADGSLAMDEAIVEQRVAATLADPGERARILARMLRFRDPKGCYGDGGCIDTTREGPRWVCPGSADLGLPDE